MNEEIKLHTPVDIYRADLFPGADKKKLTLVNLGH